MCCMRFERIVEATGVFAMDRFAGVESAFSVFSLLGVEGCFMGGSMGGLKREKEKVLHIWMVATTTGLSRAIDGAR